MQQRRVRLGDILDDYCPRERRVTNHVVVAMVDDDVKQTRCSTCDADHEYKHARVPPARKKKDGVLAALPGDAGHLRPPVTSDPPDDGLPDQTDVLDTLDETAAVVTVAESPDDTGITVAVSVAAEETPAPERDDDGPVHRRLIRATFPRQEGQAPEWKEPDFTVRQDPRGGGDREIDGNRAPGAGGGRHRRRGRGGAFGRPDAQRGGNRGQGGGNQWGQGGGAGHGFRNQGGGNRQGHGASPRGQRPQGQSHGSRPGSGSGRKRGR